MPEPGQRATLQASLHVLRWTLNGAVRLNRSRVSPRVKQLVGDALEQGLSHAFGGGRGNLVPGDIMQRYNSL